MAASPQIGISLTAVDHYSTMLAQMRKDLAQTSKAADRASNRSGSGDFGIGAIQRRVSRITGGISSGFGAVRSGASGILGAASSAARSVPGLGALAGAGTVAGIGELVTHYSDLGVSLQNTARLAGTSATQLNNLRGSARLMGLSAGEADGAMLGLQHTLQDAVFGRNPEALRYFQRFNVAVGDMRSGARSAGDVLPQIVDQLTALSSSNPNAAEHLAQLWGIPSSALPMLIQGRQQLQAYEADVNSIFGNTDNYIRQSQAFARSFSQIGLAADRLGMTVTTALAPHLAPMLAGLADWIDKPQNQRMIGDTFDHLGAALERVDWAGVARGIENIGGAITSASESVGSLTHAAELFGATALGRMLLGRGGAGSALSWLLGSTAGVALTAPLALSGDTPGARAGRPRTPEELAQMRGESAGTNQRYGYGHGFWADTWHWLSGGAARDAAQGGAIKPGDTRLPQSRSANQQSFLERYGGMAQRIAEQTGVSARVILGQLFQETGGRGDRGNNPFNLQAGRSWTGSTVTRGDTRADGTPYTTQFRAYENLNQAADDYVALLRHRYPGALNAGDDPRRFGEGLTHGTGGARYAEDPGYVDHVATAANRFQVPTIVSAPPAPALPPIALGAQQAAGSNHQITVDFNGVPNGATVRTQSQGSGAEISGVNVRKAMPEAGTMGYGAGLSY